MNYDRGCVIARIEAALSSQWERVTSEFGKGCVFMPNAAYWAKAAILATDAGLTLPLFETEAEMAVRQIEDAKFIESRKT